MASSQREISYAGRIVKCPSCGGEIPSYTAICPHCNHEINSQYSTISINEFVYHINRIESQIRMKYGAIQPDASTPLSKELATFIENYRFPNERVALLDALSYINEKIHGLSSLPISTVDLYWLDVWHRKAEAVFRMSYLVMNNDPIAPIIYNDIQTTYTEAINESTKRAQKKRSRLRRLFIFGGIVSTPLLLFFILIISSIPSTGELSLNKSLYFGKEPIFTNLSEEKVTEALQCVSGITETASGALESLGNDEKEVPFSFCVYFRHEEVNLYTSEELLEKGSICGGCVEVYKSADKAQARFDSLKNSTVGLRGKFIRIENTVIRISYLLSNKEQTEIAKNIIKELIK